jgi:hypothetical protein
MAQSLGSLTGAIGNIAGAFTAVQENRRRDEESKREQEKHDRTQQETQHQQAQRAMADMAEALRTDPTGQGASVRMATRRLRQLGPEYNIGGFRPVPQESGGGFEALDEGGSPWAFGGAQATAGDAGMRGWTFTPDAIKRLTVAQREGMAKATGAEQAVEAGSRTLAQQKQAEPTQKMMDFLALAGTFGKGAAPGAVLTRNPALRREFDHIKTLFPGEYNEVADLALGADGSLVPMALDEGGNLVEMDPSKYQPITAEMIQSIVSQRQGKGREKEVAEIALRGAQTKESEAKARQADALAKKATADARAVARLKPNQRDARFDAINKVLQATHDIGNSQFPATPEGVEAYREELLRAAEIIRDNPNLSVGEVLAELTALQFASAGGGGAPSPEDRLRQLESPPSPRGVATSPQAGGSAGAQAQPARQAPGEPSFVTPPLNIDEDTRSLIGAGQRMPRSARGGLVPRPTHGGAVAPRHQTMRAPKGFGSG